MLAFTARMSGRDVNPLGFKNLQREENESAISFSASEPIPADSYPPHPVPRTNKNRKPLQQKRRGFLSRGNVTFSAFSALMASVSKRLR